jgi:hypothetical protein
MPAIVFMIETTSEASTSPVRVMQPLHLRRERINSCAVVRRVADERPAKRTDARYSENSLASSTHSP